MKPRGMLTPGRGIGRGRVGQGSFLIFNQQFLTLIKAGLPILDRLNLLIKRQKDESLKAVLENVRERVKGGELLSDAFAAQRMFPKMYTTTLMAGEKCGNMEEVLSRYIAFQRMAMTLPQEAAGVAGVSDAADFGRDDHDGFPGHLRGAAIRQAVREPGSEAADHHGDHAGDRRRRAEVRGCSSWPVCCRGYFLMWRWKNTDKGAEVIDRVLMAFPLLGDIRLKYQVANFSRMLSTLLQGGIPLVPAMETAGASMSSRKILNGVSAAAHPRARRPDARQEPGRTNASSPILRWK